VPNAAGYSGTPLPRKLGIKAGSTLLLVNAPADFARTLGPLPDNVRVVTRATRPVDIAVWFVTSCREIDRSIAKAATWAQGLWVAWPKKTSGVDTDVNENLVRDAGLAHGIVDYKVCAIDATWSGLKFAKRRIK
jgi:hypothetical protein